MKTPNTVVLIVPKTGPILLEPPFGMMYLASFLEKAGYKPLIIDARIQDYKKVIKNLINAGDVISYNLTCMTGPQITHCLTIARYIKKLCDTPVVIGGIHPSYLPEQTMAEKVFDYVVTGYGEHILSLLVSAIVENKSVENIEGVVYRKEGKIIVNKTSEEKPARFFGSYAWHLIDVEKYIQYGFIGKKTYSLFTSRGCPFKCGFCYGTSFHKNIWQGQDGDTVLAEIDYIVAKTGVDSVFFHDDNFIVDKKRVRYLAPELKKRGINFGLCLRADCVDEEFVAFLKENNCVRIDWGAESGSDEVLKAMNKGVTAAESVKLAHLTAKYDMPAYATFVLGYPGETKEMMWETLDFINKLRKINPKLIISDIKIATPYPGSAFLKTACSLGYKPPKSFAEWGTHYWNNACLPWIDDYTLVENISMSSLFAFCDWRIKKKNRIYNFLVDVMHKIQVKRFATCNFKFALELRLAKKIIDLINFKLRMS